VSLDLVIVTPQGEVFSGVVEQVVLPGSEGDFGVLEQHERTLAPLQHGVVEIKTTSGSEWAAVSNGFADVSAERVVVLADSCVLAAEIDKAAVEAALRDAQTELGGLAELEANAEQREDLSETIRQHEAQLSAVASQ
jgi:F-type H+-transporting ATPase subunit epsilon